MDSGQCKKRKRWIELAAGTYLVETGDIHVDEARWYQGPDESDGQGREVDDGET